MGYITATHLLEQIQDRVLVVNDPAEVRNAPEKLFVLRFPDLMPPTLVTKSLEEAMDFRARHGAIVVKPLYGNAGTAVFLIDKNDGNLPALVELFSSVWREPFMVQAFLPSVAEGDKRIVLVDGEPAGAINRLPKKGEIRSNLAAGGSAQPTELTPREQEICARLGPELKKRGLIFVGIDVIGGFLTEINVTSPTGIRAIDRFNGTDTPARIWDAIKARLDARD
jgi:glutathione synthase